MELSCVDLEIPAEKPSTTSSWTAAGSCDPQSIHALEFRIEQLLQKWMEQLDRRLEELASNHRGWSLSSRHTVGFQDPIRLSRGEFQDSASRVTEDEKLSCRSSEADFQPRFSAHCQLAPADHDADSHQSCVAEDDDEDAKTWTSEKTEDNANPNRSPPRRSLRSSLSLQSKNSLNTSLSLQGRRDLQRKMMELQQNLANKKEKKLKGCGWVAHHPQFENFICLAIILNGILIGVQVDMAARTSDGDHAVFAIAEAVFFIIFFLELWLRVCGLGSEWVRSAWNMFDAVLVMLHIAELVVRWTGESTAARGGATGRIWRVFRIVRIFRVVRLLRFFGQLLVMVKMIMFSLESLFWLMILLLVMMYVVSIIFTQGVTSYLATDNLAPERRIFLKTYFSDIGTTTLTLFKAITNGISWGLLSDSLFEVHVLFGCVFVFFVFFVFFSVLNVVTGVFVDGAIQHAGQERELLVAAERKSMEGTCLKLMELLVDIDADNSGTISRDEFVAFARDPAFASYLSALQIYTPDVEELFDYLDENGDGVVDPQEFIDGCMRIRGGAKNVDLHMIFSNFEAEHKKRMRSVETSMQKMEEDVSLMSSRASGMKADIRKILTVLRGRKEDQVKEPLKPTHDDRRAKFVRGSL